MPRYLPADEINHNLFIATNLAAALYIACTNPSWLAEVAIVAVANIVPVTLVWFHLIASPLVTQV